MDKCNKEMEEVTKWRNEHLPPNGCDHPICMKSWKYEKEFDNMKDKDKEEYFRRRKENYTIDEKVFRTGITRGERLFWTQLEKDLSERFHNILGFMGSCNLLSEYEGMGREVTYISEKSKEDRASEYNVDLELIFQNAMSCNPILNSMHDGELKIYELLRRFYKTKDDIEKEKEEQRKIFDGLTDMLSDF